MLKITNLHVSIDGKEVINGLTLSINPGEIHAIMGPNGAGKSTLAKVLSGDPTYEVTGGEIEFMGQSLMDLEPQERAALGLFMGFQYPVEVPGVGNSFFLRTALNACRKANGESPLSEEVFEALLEEKMQLLQTPKSFVGRNLNEGFSGGEKKRNEILQMAILDPKLAILDETDSGLDIDAMRVVADGINKLHSADKGLLLITHYQRLLDYIQPNFVHVMVEGKILRTGGAELALELEEKGYTHVL